MEYILQLAKDGVHKFQVILPSGKIVKFGAIGYEDYIQYFKVNKLNAVLKKKNYISRHKVNEDWTDLSKAGTWSRYILWNKSTINKSIKNMQQLFGIKITLIF